MGLSDFSHPNDAISIAGQPFVHLLYQFRLAYSGWRYVQVVEGGESFAALSEGLQNALTQLGGVPIEHRTDSLSAAFNNLSEEQALTRDYEGLCVHYNLKASRNNKGVSHENGAVETAHRSLKHFIQKIVNKLNAQRADQIALERQQLRALPVTRYMDYQVLSVKVTSTSTINIKRVTYSVPSRLIGEVLSVHIHHDRLELYLAQTHVLSLKRVHVGKGQPRERQINFKHLINALAAKPQAFRYSVLQSELLPSDHYKQLWQQVDEQLESRSACKWMVGVLKIAAQLEDYAPLGEALLALAQQRQLPGLLELQAQYLPKQPHPIQAIEQHALSSYDRLLQAPASQGGSLWTH